MSDRAAAGALRDARFADLDAPTLYALLRLRVDVFVVEQACPYPDLDGRDTEPGARHVWWEVDGAPVACLRVLDDGAAVRVGRVVTAAAWRGRGLAARLLTYVLATTTGRVVLDAQRHLATWYEGFGFRVAGEEFVEDGIAHLPMALERPPDT